MRSKSVEILAAAVVLFVSACPVLATIQFNDGGIHDIDYIITDYIWVDYESPGLGTTLNILDWARIHSPYYVKGCEDSIINMFGGAMYRLYASGSSQVTVSGGSIGENLDAYGSSQVTVSGGSINQYIYARHNSEVTVSGGSIGSDLNATGDSRSQVTVSGGSIGSDLNATGDSRSQVTVSGGSIGGNLYATFLSQVTISGGAIGGRLETSNSSQVTVSGGSIGGNLDASGGSQVTVSGGLFGGELLVWDHAVLTIDGSDFAVDGTLVGYTELYSIFGGYYGNEPYRQLTGTLLSGDPLNNDFRIGGYAKIVLVPEPATICLLGLGGLGLLRRRRQA